MQDSSCKSVMTTKKKETSLIMAITISAIGLGPASAQAISPAPFTQAQSDAGRQTYAASCASCHGDSLESKGAPALSGKEFSGGAFGKRPVAQLYNFIHNSMPFCEGGSLATDAYVNVLAFLLQANGAKPGDTPLTPTTDVKLGDIITGEMPPGFLKNAKSN
jgi:mono/diheme cytochrome c family protein